MKQELLCGVVGGGKNRALEVKRSTGLHPDSDNRNLRILKWVVVCSQCCKCSKQSAACLRKAFSLVQAREHLPCVLSEEL